MKNIKLLSLAAAVGLVALAAPAHAQVPDSVFAVSSGGVGLFRVNVDAGTLWGGTFDGDGDGSGVPAEGAGTRMLWYPRKAAFRAGGISGTQWDAANIGSYSVAIGRDVRASGDYGVAFGLRTTAAQSSSFAVGEDNVASGYASVALGYHAHTNARRGSFVFGDNISGGTGDSIRAELVGQAVWRVSCGMRIYTNQALTTGVSFGGPAVNPTVCGSSYYHGQPNAMISTSTGAYLHTNGTWTNASDVNRKHRFAEISGEDVLARLRSLPITSWTYRTENDDVRHIGPMAQDFRATFGLGDDDKVISTVDADGVALAAAQALATRTDNLRGEVTELRGENAELRGRVQTLEEQNAALEARLRRVEALLEAQEQPRR
ncbi:tail fiber domain-containing protein [Longimicrobium sp.]|uniref:tail fiber domain-containing protein n=1 Tax=Longimicrobium sp. TaxID=2029185 RepID=UPI003B3B0C8A